MREIERERGNDKRMCETERERDKQSVRDSSIMQNKPAENNMDGLQ